MRTWLHLSFRHRRVVTTCSRTDTSGDFFLIAGVLRDRPAPEPGNKAFPMISYISRRKKKKHKKQNVTVLHWSVVDKLIGGGRRSLRSLHVVCWPSTSSIHSAHCAVRSESMICHIRSFQPFLDDLFLEGGDLHICYAPEGPWIVTGKALCAQQCCRCIHRVIRRFSSFFLFIFFCLYTQYWSNYRVSSLRFAFIDSAYSGEQMCPEDHLSRYFPKWFEILHDLQESRTSPLGRDHEVAGVSEWAPENRKTQEAMMRAGTQLQHCAKQLSNGLRCFNIPFFCLSPSSTSELNVPFITRNDHCPCHIHLAINVSHSQTLTWNEAPWAAKDRVWLVAATRDDKSMQFACTHKARGMPKQSEPDVVRDLMMLMLAELAMERFEVIARLRLRCQSVGARRPIAASSLASGIKLAKKTKKTSVKRRSGRREEEQFAFRVKSCLFRLLPTGSLHQVLPVVSLLKRESEGGRSSRHDGWMRRVDH